MWPTRSRPGNERYAGGARRSALSRQARPTRSARKWPNKTPRQHRPVSARSKATRPGRRGRRDASTCVTQLPSRSTRQQQGQAEAFLRAERLCYIVSIFFHPSRLTGKPKEPIKRGERRQRPLLRLLPRARSMARSDKKFTPAISRRCARAARIRFWSSVETWTRCCFCSQPSVRLR